MANLTAYGFVQLKDLFRNRAISLAPNIIRTAIEESLAEHTANINGLLAEFVELTTSAQEQFDLPSGGTLQPIDESGNPLPVKFSGSYQVAFPIQGGATAWGNNRVTRALMTVEETNKFTVDAMSKDADWMSRHLLAAILTNTAWVFNDTVGENGSRGLGNVTVQPLANGDSVAYTMTGGATSPDNHYLAQLAGISDANNPFPAIKLELSEHPSNANGDIICWCSDNLSESIRGLTAFVSVPDSDIQDTSLNDRIVRTPDLAFGELLGKVDGVWVAEYKRLPAGYMMAHATGGGPILKMREYPSPALQGFFPEQNNVDGNHLEFRMIRYAGFGVANRVGGLAMQIGSATYTTPAQFAAPLAV
jgi:hypothetical protein